MFGHWTDRSPRRHRCPQPEQSRVRSYEPRTARATAGRPRRWPGQDSGRQPALPLRPDSARRPLPSAQSWPMPSAQPLRRRPLRRQPPPRWRRCRQLPVTPAARTQLARTQIGPARTAWVPAASRANRPTRADRPTTRPPPRRSVGGRRADRDARRAAIPRLSRRPEPIVLVQQGRLPVRSRRSLRRAARRRPARTPRRGEPDAKRVAAAASIDGWTGRVRSGSVMKHRPLPAGS